jgi:hypothetical protein
MNPCTSEPSWLDSLHYPKAERYKDLRKAIAFLKSIKIPLRESPPTEPCPPNTFFPWVWIENSTLVYRKNSVDIGQLLHEAGHLALMPPAKRSLANPSKLPPGPIFGDLAVEAWDYYAAKAADIFPMLIFAKNFENKGLQVYTQLENGVHYGIAILKSIEFLKGDRMVRWQMGDVDELSNLVAKIALSKGGCWYAD